MEERKLLPSDGAEWDKFGTSVSISGDVALVGAYLNDSGSAYVFRWNGSTWIEEQKLLASDAAVGDRFGYSVSTSGDVALVGAYWDDDNDYNSGSAYVFRWNGSTWIEEQKLLASDGAADDHFGYSVSISENVALVGAPLDGDNGSQSGSTYVFYLIQANLALSKADGPDPILSGNNLTYTLDIINNGPYDATGVIVIDTLPGEVNFVSVTPTQGSCSESLGTVTCNLGDLSNGITATIVIVATPIAEGLITNTADVTGNEFDPENTNNSATANTIIHPTIPPMLSVMVPVMASEGDGLLLGQGTVNISDVLSTDLTIYLSSSDITEVSVPTTVVIPQDSTSANFDLTIEDDSIIDGTQSVAITVSVPNWAPALNTIQVADNEQMELFVSIPPFANEGDGTVQGSVSIPGTLGSNLVVSLNSSDTTEVSVPASAIITAGQTSTNFNLTIVDDSVFDGTQTVTVTASSTGWTSASDTIDVQDIEDTDGDLLPDWWETQYFGDLSQDGDGDYDGDGVSNLDEYNDERHPANMEPETPVLSLPLDGTTGVDLAPILETNAFNDADENNHATTEWQISTQQGDFSDDMLVFKSESTLALTVLAVPSYILAENTTYYWQVRFHDDGDAASEWAVPFEFTTGASGITDNNSNGIPDSQDLGPNESELDLDDNGTFDINESSDTWKCLNTETGNGHVGVKVSPVPPVPPGYILNAVESVDPESISDTVNKPDILPHTLVNFSVTVPNIGDSVDITVYLSGTLPANTLWYTWNAASGWQQIPATFSQTNAGDTKVVFRKTDGGTGDADGLADGVIVDPSGPGAVAGSPTPPGGGGGGSGGGCFIATAAYESSM